MKAKLVKESLNEERFMTPERAERIASLVDEMIIKSHDLDLSSAYDCAGFGNVETDMHENVFGRGEFIQWLINDDWADDMQWNITEPISDNKFAREVFKWIKQKNKEFGNYWDGNINSPN